MNRRRGFALVIATGALLVFANACQADADDAAVFRSGQYVEDSLDGVLAARHADQLNHLQIQIVSLLVLVTGAGLAASRPGRRNSQR